MPLTGPSFAFISLWCQVKFQLMPRDLWKIEVHARCLAPFGSNRSRPIPISRRSMDNPFVIFRPVVPCPMFPRVGRLSFGITSTCLPATPPWPPFVFITSRIACSACPPAFGRATPLYSNRYELRGRAPSAFSVLRPSALSVFRFSVVGFVSPCSSHCYKLFGILRKVNSFAFKQIRTLLQKNTGGGGISSGSHFGKSAPALSGSVSQFGPQVASCCIQGRVP